MTKCSIMARVMVIVKVRGGLVLRLILVLGPALGLGL
jgi:hypothetical protein